MNKSHVGINTIYAVYRSSKKYRETAQVSWVSTIPRVSYVIKSFTVKHCASSSHSVSHQVLLHCPSLG